MPTVPVVARRGPAVAHVPMRILVALAVVLLAVLLIGPLWDTNGMPNSADGILHLHRAADMTRSWAEGVLWPRWYVGGYAGLGSPLYHYYGPLFHELVAPLHLLSISLDMAAKIVLTAFFLLSAAALYAWLSRLFSPTAALAGAALYLAAPHFFREYYFQGDYPQTISLFWLPVMLWAFTRLYDDDRPLNWLVAVLSVAVLAVGHNLTAMLGAGFLAFYWMSLPLWRSSNGGWRRTAAAAVLGLGLSAFFWLPALADIPAVRIDALRNSFFSFTQHFVYGTDLLAGPPVLDTRATNPPFPYLLGWPGWIALAGGLLLVGGTVAKRVLRRDAGPNSVARIAALGLIIAIVCLALTQAWSEPVWERVRPLSLLQFPGRLLGPAALAAALVGAAVVHACRVARAGLVVLPVSLIVVSLCTAVFLFPRLPFVSMPRSSMEDAQAYERATGNWGLTSANEFLPRWAATDESRQDGGSAVSVPEGTEWRWQTPHRAVLRSLTGETLPAGALVLPLHYFPTWQVRAGAETLSAQPDGKGLLRVDVPPGATQVDVVWHGTPWEVRGKWVSVVSLTLVLAGAAVLVVRRRNGVDRPEVAAAPAGSAGDSSAILLAVGVLFALVVLRYAIRLGNLGWFQQSSPAGSVAGVTHPTQIDFTSTGGTQVTLLGWEILPGSAARPGGDLRVRLYWDAAETTEENLQSFVHLTTESPNKSWAVAQNQYPGGVPTSRWTDTLYVVDDLVLHLPLDLLPATYALAAGMVDGEDKRLSAEGGNNGLAALGDVGVEPLRVGQAQPLRPSVASSARFGNLLQLQGYDLKRDGATVKLDLFWQVLNQPVDAAVDDLTAFVHVLDGSGEMIAQFDGPLAEGLPVLHTAGPGALIVDAHTLPLDPAALGRARTMLVGLYHRGSMARLPVTPVEGAASQFNSDNALVIPFEPVMDEPRY